MPATRDKPRMPPEVHDGGLSFSRAELVRSTSPHAVRMAIASGEIALVLPGRYASGPHARSWLVRSHAGVSVTHGVVTGKAALLLAGAERRAPDVIDVTTSAALRAPAVPWLRVERQPRLPPAARWRGIDIARPAWSVIHEWRRGKGTDRVGTVLRALQRRVCTPDDVRAAMRRTPRVRDRAGLHRVLEAFESGAHSFLEHESLTRVFAHREFSRFVRQHQVVARGETRFLDMYDPATRTNVELDGDEFHLPGEQRVRDNRREADLATLGIQTIRLSYEDVMGRPAWCRDIVSAVLRSRESHDQHR
ncbi:endonuclease domain-containing protein [Demequina gelatinilytica]|uniref:endonuclease domain-containing protein n=1 Tax=Demequina gelatinilytica TaxID=1638980 RepID=UPI000B1BA7CC|nr:hypothetical protein [Demequina gelatinilytica]